MEDRDRSARRSRFIPVHTYYCVVNMQTGVCTGRRGEERGVTKKKERKRDGLVIYLAGVP